MGVQVLKLAPTDAFRKVVPGRSPEIVALEESVAALAACKDAPEADKAAFYPEVTSPAQAAADIGIAKSYCRRCPAESMCLQLAFLTDAGRWGVWAGTTEQQRKAMRRRLRQRGDAAA